MSTSNTCHSPAEDQSVVSVSLSNIPVIGLRHKIEKELDYVGDVGLLVEG